VICNRIGGRGHLALLRSACEAPPVLGGFPIKDDLAFPERHLGLVTASENAVSESTFDAWGQMASEWIDMGAMVDRARSAPELPTIVAPKPGHSTDEKCRIGIAWDEAFHFYYEDNLARLVSLGATLVRFSPLRDAEPPPVDGLYFGGGYPEVYGHLLSANMTMRNAVATFAYTGGPVYAECGGLMYLSRGIRTRDGVLHAMVGLVPAEAIMKDRLAAIGYVEVETQVATILGPPGLRFRGHQFRYSELGTPNGELNCPYAVSRPPGSAVSREGFASNNVVASYVHAHWASNPHVAEAFVASCATRRARA
jgi:cobyrinic acid a,c-diamide synthase